MTPQPVGVPPWPAGMLLVPELDDPAVAAVAQALLLGIEPEVWPTSLSYVRHALGGDVRAAIADLDAHPDPGSPVWAFNRAVLTGDDDVLARLVEHAIAAPELRAMAAAARFTLGQAEAPAVPAPDLPGEVAAIVYSARASAALEAGQPHAAVDELARGAERAWEAGSPLLASALHAGIAEVHRDGHGDLAAALAAADAAVAALPVSTSAERRAEVLLLRGVLRYQAAAGDRPDRSAVMAAVSDLQAALQTFREDRDPEQFAQASQYLALCYLVVPMSGPGDRIRLAVAVSSLRAALRVLQPQTHGQAWVSAALNLANALQYLPSTHREQNLAEAADMYDAVLERRSRQSDPAGYARVLANQANALAHLGRFERAIENYVQAKELFSLAGETDAVSAVDGQLAEIERTRSTTS